MRVSNEEIWESVDRLIGAAGAPGGGGGARPAEIGRRGRRRPRPRCCSRAPCPRRPASPGCCAPLPERRALVLAAHAWTHGPLIRLRDLLDVALMTAKADRDELERLAEDWGTWARNLSAARERTVLEQHARVGSAGTHLAAPPGSAHARREPATSRLSAARAGAQAAPLGPRRAQRVRAPVGPRAQRLAEAGKLLVSGSAPAARRRLRRARPRRARPCPSAGGQPDDQLRVVVLLRRRR